MLIIPQRSLWASSLGGAGAYRAPTPERASLQAIHNVTRWFHVDIYKGRGGGGRPKFLSEYVTETEYAAV